jgi:capsular exopolysaccharide synthesis family protein
VGYPSGYYPEAYMEEYDDEYDGASGGVSLRAVWRAAKKRKWLIIIITVIVTTAVATDVSRYRRTYSASVLLEVRRETVGPIFPAGVDLDPLNVVNINTKILMIMSRPLVEDVVRKLDLPEDSRFVDIADKRSWGQMFTSLLSRLGLDNRSYPARTVSQTPTRAVGTKSVAQSRSSDAVRSQQFPDIPESDPSLDRYVAILQSGLDVSQPRDTQALRITFSHTYPTIAAAVANGVAQSFIEKNFEKKTESFNNTSTWLEKSTADLKARMAQAEQSLADYTREHSILPSQGQSFAADSLIRLYDQLSRADTNLVLKQSLYDEVVSGRGDRLPEAFADPKIGDLQRRIDEMTVSEAQLGMQYGPDNPKLKEVQKAKAVLLEQLAASKVALQEKVKADYESAVRDRSAIAAALEKARAEASEQDQSSVQYNILKEEAATASALYKDFLQKTNQANLQIAQQHNNISVIQPAEIPRHPDGPSYGVAVLLALLGSLGGSVGLAFLIEHFDRTIKGVGDVNRYLRLPTLGVIPSIPGGSEKPASLRARRQNPQLAESGDGQERVWRRWYPAGGQDTAETDQAKGRLLTAGGLDESFGFNGGRFITPQGWHLAAEAYRALRTSVLLSAEGPPKTLLFTSGQPGEGKTTTVVNTAICFAQLGRSVLVIDSDLRKPYGRTGLAGSGEIGLSSILCGTTEINRAIYRLAIPHVSLLPRGPACPNPAEVISSDRMRELLGTLSESYDHILIDSPPLLCATDSVILSTLVDGVILVVRGGKSRRDSVYQARLLLSNVGAKVVGIVLNDIDFRNVPSHEVGYYPYAKEGEGREVEGASDILLP